MSISDYFGRARECDKSYFTDKMTKIIDQFETVKDLGVVMNDQATFKNHIEKALSKARQKVGGGF